MKTVFDLPQIPPDYSALTAAQLRLLLVQKDVEIAAIANKKSAELNQIVREKDKRIVLLEELLRLARLQRFAAKSEKLAFQINLFDEAELEAAIDELADQTADDGPQNQRLKNASGASQTIWSGGGLSYA